MSGPDKGERDDEPGEGDDDEGGSPGSQSERIAWPSLWTLARRLLAVWRNRDRGPQVSSRRTTRVLGGSLLVLAVTGVPLIWQYHPEKRSLLQDLHMLATFVFLIATLVLLVQAVAGRIRRRPAPLGWLAAFVVLLLTTFGGASGETLAFNGFTLSMPVGMEYEYPDEGIFTALRPEVEQVLVGSDELTPSAYQMVALIHIALIPLLMLGTYALGRRRSSRTDQADESDESAPRDESDAPEPSALAKWGERTRTRLRRQREALGALAGRPR